MMTVAEQLDELQKIALNDENLRLSILKTAEEENPLRAFCEIARERGFELYPMDVVLAGEEFVAAMKRSTNGGGENSPMLNGEDDFYELFLAAIR